MSEPYDVIVFTDGACIGNPGPGGWGAILRHVQTGVEKRLTGGHPQTTNNRMEMTAVIEGLAALTRAPLHVQVVSDSDYVCRGMSEWLPGWRANDWRRSVMKRGRRKLRQPIKNVDLWKRLAGLADQHRVVFTHVAGHAGHPENEECDQMAVRTAEEAASGKYGEPPRQDDQRALF